MTSQRLKKNKGQSSVEFTLGFLLLYTVIMAIIEFSHMFYTKTTLQHAIAEAGRYMITGQGIDHTELIPTLVCKKFKTNSVII